MKLLKQPERVVVPAENAASPAVVIINDPAAVRQLIATATNTPTYEQCPAATYRTIPAESRIQGLIRNERKILGDAFDEFVSATRHFLGTMITWFLWRIIVPLCVMSVLWMTVAESAELPV